MNRVKIELPNRKLFTTSLYLRVSDINYGAHLGNDTVVSLIHEARYRMFNSWGYKSDLEIEGIGTIQLDTAIQYKGEGFHGDHIHIDIYLGEVGSRAFELYYKISTAKKLIALGKTGLGMYNYDQKKMVSIPDSLIEKLEAH
jgi:acyl-CoA thioesterase FadM